MVPKMEIIWLKMESIWLKMETIWLKMETIWLKMEVVWLLEPPGARSSHPTEDRWKNGWPPGRPGRPPRTQRDPKNRLEIACLLKKGRYKRGFLLIFSRKAVFYALDAFFHQFSTKNRWKINEKNNAFFQCSACFFEHGDPHETSYFTMRKLLFHFSCFCVFSTKNVEKWLQNAKSNFASQNHQRTVPGDLFWVQNWTRINVGEAKKSQNRQKNCKIRRSIFWSIA